MINTTQKTFSTSVAAACNHQVSVVAGMGGLLTSHP